MPPGDDDHPRNLSHRADDVDRRSSPVSRTKGVGFDATGRKVVHPSRGMDERHKRCIGERGGVQLNHRNGNVRRISRQPPGPQWRESSIPDGRDTEGRFITAEAQSFPSLFESYRSVTARQSPAPATRSGRPIFRRHNHVTIPRGNESCHSSNRSSRTPGQSITVYHLRPSSTGK